MRINIEPMSVNRAWQGKRFKTPEYTAWRNQFVYLIRQHMYPALSGVPLRVEVMFGLTKKNFAKSDVDNLLKPFFDGLQDAGVIANDRYVYEIEAKKVLSTESFILFSVMKL